MDFKLFKAVNQSAGEPSLISPNLDWNPKLAHLRFLAALLVFLFHSGEMFCRDCFARAPTIGSAWMTEGYTGVTLFFVLSGYLFMTIALSKDRDINYRSFLKNRALRVLPLFTFFFFAAISIKREKFQPYDILSVLFSNLGDSVLARVMITGAAWTVSVELTFYLVFPFLAKFTREYGPAFLLKLIALILIIKVAGYFLADHAVMVMYLTIVGRFDQFLIGMLAACIVGHFPTWSPSGRWVVASLLALWASLEFLARVGSLSHPGSYRLWMVWPTVEAILWCFVVVVYSRWRGNIPAALGAFLEKGGEMSYSIYLWHFTVLFLVQKMLGAPDWGGDPTLDFYAATFVAFCLLWVVSRLSYDAIEAPFLKLRVKYL